MAEQKSSQPNPANNGPDTQTLGITEADWDRYVAKLIAGAEDNRRDTYRHARIIQCLVRIEGEEDGHVFVVHSRDISDGGLSFLHGSTFPEGAACTVVLETNLGRAHVIRAEIAWAREVGTDVHAIGLRFEDKLDLRPFIDVDPSSGVDAA